MLPWPNALLAAVYVVYLAAGLYASFTGGVPPTRIAALLLAGITLAAVLGAPQRWVRVTGLVYGGLLSLLGMFSVGTGIWLAQVGRDTTYRLSYIGLVLLAFGAATLYVLTRQSLAADRERADDESA